MVNLKSELEGLAYDTLKKGLGTILQSSGSLMADSYIRNLNIGLCLVQCGLGEHPLVTRMALGKKRYEAYWSNDEQLEKILQYWLQTEVVISRTDLPELRVNRITREALGFTIKYYDDLIVLQQENRLTINPYTFIMGSQLLLNLHKLGSGEAVDEHIRFCILKVAEFAQAQMVRGGNSLLDFCLLFLAGASEYLEEQEGKAFLDKLARHVRAPLVNGEIDYVDDNTVAHLLMDLEQAEYLEDGEWAVGIDCLATRIKAQLAREVIDVQALTRLTRALGALSRRFKDMSARLYAALTPVYARGILDEVRRRVIDEEGYAHEKITNVMEPVKSGYYEVTPELLLKILHLPLAQGYEAKAGLEYLDVVKAPHQTLIYGGDCDCTAAMYAALLLNAGVREVHLFHLEPIEGGDFHVVASVRKDGEGDIYYCFDPLLIREGGALPRLTISPDGMAWLSGAGLAVHRFNTVEHRLLSIATAGDYSNLDRVCAGLDTRGLPTFSFGVFTRILFHVPGGGESISDCIFERMKQDALRDSFVDKVYTPEMPAFAQVAESFGARGRDIPALGFLLAHKEGEDKIVAMDILNYKQLRSVFNAYEDKEEFFIRLEQLVIDAKRDFDKTIGRLQREANKASVSKALQNMMDKIVAGIVQGILSVNP